MKRCLNCCALIREDDDKCPYCHDNPDMLVDEFISLSKNFERVGDAFRQLGMTAKELEKRAKEAMSGMTLNEIRKSVGLGEINNEEDK